MTRQRLQLIRDWLRAHGIDPGTVPMGASFTFHPPTNTWTVDTLDVRTGVRGSVTFKQIEPWPDGA